MSKSKALSPEQVRERLRARGETLASWARKHGYRYQAVCRVMGGQAKGYFGLSHEIAVALGLKISVEAGQYDNTASAGGNPQARKAA